MLGLKRPWPNFIHRWPRSCAPGSSVIPDGPAVTTEQTDMIYTDIYMSNRKNPGNTKYVFDGHWLMEIDGNC